jgi:hypothetical protein
METLVETSEREISRLEVVKLVVAGMMTQVAAGKRLSLTDRQIRRLLGRYSTEGARALALAAWTDWHLARVFEHFYRYGYLVFGGGQVVVPVMHSELVEGIQVMTSGEFLTGYGLVQGLAGPMFSFAAYAGLA